MGDSIVRKRDSRLSEGRVLWFVYRENRACDRKCRSWEEEMERPFWSTSGQLVGKEELYSRDGLHLSRKGPAMFAEGLSGAVASGLGKVRYVN